MFMGSVRGEKESLQGMKKTCEPKEPAGFDNV